MSSVVVLVVVVVVLLLLLVVVAAVAVADYHQKMTFSMVQSLTAGDSFFLASPKTAKRFWASCLI